MKTYKEACRKKLNNKKKEKNKNNIKQMRNYMMKELMNYSGIICILTIGTLYVTLKLFNQNVKLEYIISVSIYVCIVFIINIIFINKTKKEKIFIKNTNVAILKKYRIIIEKKIYKRYIYNILYFSIVYYLIFLLFIIKNF